MTKWIRIAMLSALAPWAFSGTAHARMSDDQCAEQVAQECGPVPFEQCFDDASMWDKISSDCTAWVQTNLENAREADQQVD